MPPLHDGLKAQLDQVAGHLADILKQLEDPAVYQDVARYTSLMKERGRIEGLVSRYQAYQSAEQQLGEAREMARDAKDPEFAAMAAEEAVEQEAARDRLREEIREALVSQDEDGDRNVIMEIRAGTGGDEASLFAADLFEMYSRYAQQRNWKIKVLSAQETDLGGFREIVLRVVGDQAYQVLRFEGGGHRVQRVPQTESQGRIHTSACTVAVLPEVDEVEVNINPGELRIDTYRSSGPGGQHVNKTDSAIRITHLPSGLVVQCQDEKSQHKNKARAMSILRSRLYERMQAERKAQRGELRRDMIGSGDRSERIRTYNYPQNRVTDHRIGYTAYNLKEKVLPGDLSDLVDALVSHDREQRLKQLDL